MARIHEEEDGFYYEVDEFEILLDDSSYQAFQHRDPEWRLLDWVGVLDPRDGEHFSHWRYDQPPEAFEQMMDLARKIGTYILTNTPYDYVEDMFNRGHSLTDGDFETMLEVPGENIE